MSRVVHRVGVFIACVIRGRALLLLPQDFSLLVDRLMIDLGPKNRVFFKLAVLQNIGLGDARRKHADWEQIFSSRVAREIGESRFDPCYTFVAADAQTNVNDYLEAFRASFRHINVAVGEMHDGSDILYNVSIRAKQSILDLIKQQYGKVVAEWNFPQSQVERIEGSSLNFILTIAGNKYAFTPEGVSRQ